MSVNATSKRVGQRQATSNKATSNKNDMSALWAGVLFSALFSGLIWSLGPWLNDVRATLLPDSGASWYYWRLPVETMGAKLSAWGLYLTHQGAIWWLIYKAQQAKSRYSDNLQWFNWAALGVNAAGAFLHLLQTHIWYDGLAQDVSIWSSQWSVIIMLVLIVLMENPRRGTFFGQKAPLPQRAVSFIRKYHGFIFSWGIIYTFWYHPMETTQGHLVGFFYTMLLMLQGSLFFTRAHLNRWWSLSLETLVLIHGVMVAMTQPSNMWPMFGFGFGGILVVTQMHGLGLGRWLRGLLLAAYILSALGVYYFLRDIGQIYQITFIPVTYYLCIFAFAFAVAGVAGLWDKMRGNVVSGA